MEQKYIYVGLLSSPFKTGKFIRFMTGFPYNHSVISFEEDIKTSYSFARRHRPHAFYSGFIKESILRYSNGENIGKAAIFKIPVTEEQYFSLKNKLEEIFLQKESYIYNLISAGFFVFKKPVEIERTYTCLDFVLSMLKKYSDLEMLKTKDFYTIKEVYNLLQPYKIYEGSTLPLQKNANWNGDTFLEEIEFSEGLKRTFETEAELIKRFFAK